MARWKEEEDRVLGELVEAGCSIEQIAAVLRNHPRGGIEMRIYKKRAEGVIKSPAPDIDYDLYKRLLKPRKI